MPPTIERLAAPLPLPPGIGRRFLAAGLHSRGNDFTATSWLGPAHVGVSRLKSLWTGQEKRLPWDSLVAWVIRHGGEDVGIIAWERPQDFQPAFLPETPSHPLHRPKRYITATDLGGLGCYMRPDMRGRGWIGRTIVSHVAPELSAAARQAHAAGAFPYVGAEGAMLGILGRTKVPAVGFYLGCANKEPAVWSLNERAMCNDSPFRVRPVAIPPAPRARRRRGACP